MNLSQLQKKLVYWHYRLGHLLFRKIQNLMLSGTLTNTEATCRLHTAAYSGAKKSPCEVSVDHFICSTKGGGCLFIDHTPCYVYFLSFNHCNFKLCLHYPSNMIQYKQLFLIVYFNCFTVSFILHQMPWQFHYLPVCKKCLGLCGCCCGTMFYQCILQYHILESHDSLTT